MPSQRGENAAVQAVAQMRQEDVVDLDADLAMRVASLGSGSHRLPLADSVILATARTHGATLRTQNADFDGIDVRVR